MLLISIFIIQFLIAASILGYFVMFHKRLKNVEEDTGIDLPRYYRLISNFILILGFLTILVTVGGIFSTLMFKSF